MYNMSIGFETSQIDLVIVQFRNYENSVMSHILLIHYSLVMIFGVMIIHIIKNSMVKIGGDLDMR
jgi:hypothetical protein